MKKYNERINKPIFIVGCGRSGTTLLFNILKKHPILIPTTGSPDGEDHSGWIINGQCLISGIGNVDNSPGVTGYHYCLHMDEKNVTSKIRVQMNHYYDEQILKGQTSKRIVNKNPHLSNKLRYARSIFPDAKFIHIIRDCFPVVSSWIKMMKAQKEIVLYWPSVEFPCLWVLDIPEGKNRETLFRYDDRFFPGGGMLRLADYWSTVNRNIPIQLLDTPNQLLTIRYEDLVVEPGKTLSRVCDFCEIDRFSEIPVPIQPHMNEKYKNQLTDEQCTNILLRTKTTRNIFGYLESGKEKTDRYSEKTEEVINLNIELSAPFLHNGGYAWTAVFDKRMGITGGDTEGYPDQSNLRLFENEDELRPSHVLHDVIRKVGEGAYSHWGNTLYFSTSDNSNPNSNGRLYRIFAAKKSSIGKIQE